MAGTILNLLGISALDITGISAVSTAAGVTSFTVSSATVPGGSSGDIQYNNAGVFGGSAATITASGTVAIPVGQVLEFDGSGYATAGLSWLAADTLAIGDGVQGDVSGGLGLTALILFGSSAYSYYDLFHTTIMSGATQNWNLILPETPGSPGQVLTTNGLGFTSWTTPAASSVPWSSITNPTGNLSLSNAAFTTTFNQTSAVAWLWANTTTGTAITTNASPRLELAAQYYTGSASATDLWTIGSSLAAGSNGIPTLAFTHTGSTGFPVVTMPGSLTLTGSSNSLVVVGAAAAGVSASGGIYCGFIASSNGTNYKMGFVPSVPALRLASDTPLTFSSTVDETGTKDSGISRLAAGSIAVGNGTAGNTTGNLSYNRLNVAGGDHAGTVTITAAGTSATITYAANYTGAAAPVVVVTPTSDPLAAGVPVGYWVVPTGSTTAWTGFTINIQTALAGNIIFNYVVIGKA